jgi:acyl-CoA thioesterase-1
MLRGIDPGIIRAALESIVQRLAARRIPVMLAGMLAPPNLGEAYAGRFNAIYPDLARSHGLVLYPFFLDGVADVRTLNLSDGMHPSPSGVERIVDGILPYVETFIGRIRAER